MVCVTGPLVLKSNMSFHVASGAILDGSIHPEGYLPMIGTRYMGVECDCNKPLIRVGAMDRSSPHATRNVTICGEGEIRAGGETLGLQQVYDQRSRLILIQNARNVATSRLPRSWLLRSS
jgi:polygalacturonase